LADGPDWERLSPIPPAAATKSVAAITVQLAVRCEAVVLQSFALVQRELDKFRFTVNRHRWALAGFPCHTTGHTGPYHGGSAG